MAEHQQAPPPSYPEHFHSPSYSSELTNKDTQSMQQAFGSSSPFDKRDRSTLAPWLGLRARLVLSPISVALVSLIFVGTRLLLSSSDVSDSVSSAKARFLASCNGVEEAASLAASLPHFLASSTNADLGRAITATVHGAGRVTLLAITALEEVLTYLVDSYRSLFLCFMELLVRGSLAVLIAAVELIQQAVQLAAQTIRTAIQESIQGVNSIIASALSSVNDVISVFGQQVTVPTIAVPSLTALENITLPTTIQDSLTSLNASLPTLSDLKERMDTLIQTPFEDMKTQINQTISSFSFDESLLPVPDMSSVAFCDQIDTSPLDDLEHDLKKVARTGILLLILLAVGLVLLCAGKEWWCWKTEIKHVERTREAWLMSHKETIEHEASEKSQDDQGLHTDAATTARENILETSNLMTLLEISKRPLLSCFALRICQRLGISSLQARARVSWFLSFISYPAAVACLFAGVIGLLSIYAQLFALDTLSSRYTTRLSSSLSNLSSAVVDLVNEQTRNASVEFASSANSVITEMESDLNTHLFAWVDTTTTTLNTTLNEFLDGVTDVLTSTFGGTPFNAPLQTFVDCILGQKVKGIESALTWIHDNAHVNFSTVPDDVLMLSDDRQEQLVQPIRQSLLGSEQGDGDGGLVGTIVSRYRSHLEKELVMFWVLVGIYGAVLVIGLAVVLFAILRDRNLPNSSDGRGSTRNFFGFGQNKQDAYGRLSPFCPSSRTVSPVTATRDLPALKTETSSMRSASPAVKMHGKDRPSISYPFQVISSLDTHDQVRTSQSASQSTGQVTTKLSNVNEVEEEQKEATAAQTPKAAPRSTWLSFLDRAASSVDSHGERLVDEQPARGRQLLSVDAPLQSQNERSGVSQPQSQALSQAQDRQIRISRAGSPFPLLQPGARVPPQPSVGTFPLSQPTERQTSYGQHPPSSSYYFHAW